VVHFCADFDEGLVTAGWEEAVLEPGVISLEGTTAVSPPSSARIEMDAGAGDCVYTMLVRTLPGQVSAIHAEVEAFLDPDEAGPFQTSLLAVHKQGSATHCSLFVDTTATGSTIQEQDFSTDGGELDFFHDSATSIPRQRWAKVALDADYAAGTVRLTMDDGALVEGEALDPSCRGPGTIEFDVGFFCQTSGSVRRNALFDNVLLEGR
jgi:hypothetical protein